MCLCFCVSVCVSMLCAVCLRYRTREIEKVGQREHQGDMFSELPRKKCSCPITPPCITPVLLSLAVEYLYFIPEIWRAGLECTKLWFLSERRWKTFDTNHRVHILV